MEIRYQSGRTDTIRLLGVDTPETYGQVSSEEFEGIPDTRDGRAWLSDWGSKASSFAQTELAGRTVRIATDPEADRRGGYDRLLVYLYVDGTNFNKQLLTEGYARLYDSQFSKRQAFVSAEEQAQESTMGLWGYSTPAAPDNDDSGGSGSGHLEVASVHEDAAGNDHENKNDEYLVFENTGSVNLDIGGWIVYDEAEHSYRVPSGTTVGAGSTITLYTGSGTDSDTALYWGSDSAIWNNGGDTTVVENDAGQVVIEHSY